MNTVWAFVRANLVRLRADRSNIFWVIILPMLIVFAVGAALGGSAEGLRLGVVDDVGSPLTRSIRDRIAVGDVEVVTYHSEPALRDDVARGVVDAGWSVDDVDGTVTLRWHAGDVSRSLNARNAVLRAADDASVRTRAVELVAADTGLSEADAATALDAAPVTPVVVRESTVGATELGSVANVRAVLAAGQLTLFIFLTSLTGATYLLLTRLLGITRRAQAAPSRVVSIIVGEGLGRFAVALIQAAIVFFGSWWLFGVDWKSPAAVWALSAAMALVGTGAAMLLGAVARTEQQVSAISLLLSLVLAALGGSMQPIEFFPDGLRKVGFATTPHAWMNDALWRVLIEGAGLREVLPAVAVLVGIAIALLASATLLMSRALR